MLQEDSNPNERYCTNKVVTGASFLSRTEDRLAMFVISFATTLLKEIHGSSLGRQLGPNYYWYRLHYSLPSLRKYHSSSSRCSELISTAVLTVYLLFSSAASLLASLGWDTRRSTRSKNADDSCPKSELISLRVSCF
jgi:hypothetical protein